MSLRRSFALCALLFFMIAVSPENQAQQTTPPQITLQPGSITVTAPAVATFSVYAEGNPFPTVQWYKNGKAISGATDWTYETAETTTADNGAKFSAVVKNSAGKATSNNATLTVKPPSISGTDPIVGEWSGSATIRAPGTALSTAQVVVAFSQNAYSLIGTIVFTDDSGIPSYGVGVASLNNTTIFTAADTGGTTSIAAAFTSDLLTLNGFGAAGGSSGTDADSGSGQIKISTDHSQLTGSAKLSDGTALSWTLTREQ